MRVAMPHSRSASAAHAGIRWGSWIQPIHAEMLANFGPHATEHQFAELRPWGPTGGVTVSCCSLGGHYEAQTLERHSTDPTSTSQLAVQMLATFFYGGGGLSPRILGPIEWSSAALTLRCCDDNASGTLLQLQIRSLVDGTRQTMASCRLEQDGAHKAFLLYLRPADADPLYALLRVALGQDIDHGFTV